MGRKIVLYTLLTTGVIVTAVGIHNLYVFWGELSIQGVLGQFTGAVCIFGGIVNLWVASTYKKNTTILQKDRESLS